MSPQQPQRQFWYYMNGRRMWQQLNRFESYILADAMALAKRMMSSPRGLHFTTLSIIFADYEARHGTPSAELDLTIPIDENKHARVKRQISEFLDDGFEMRVDVATRADARVSPQRDPRVIWVRSEMSHSADSPR